VLLLALAGCTPAPSGQIAATVTFAGIDPDDGTQVTASGEVSGVAEGGGTCTFTFWAEGGSASRLTDEGEDAGDRVRCGPVSESVGLLNDDNYEVELVYVSDAVDKTRSERIPMSIP
jgi:hypothetical protein